jgi:hypothetical protein
MKQYKNTVQTIQYTANKRTRITIKTVTFQINIILFQFRNKKAVLSLEVGN